MHLIRVRILLVCGRFELCYCTKTPFECFHFTLLPRCNGYEVGVVVATNYVSRSN